MLQYVTEAIIPPVNSRKQKEIGEGKLVPQI